MDNFLFWKNWNFTTKFLFFKLLMVSISCLAYYTWTFDLGNDNVISWEKAGELDVVPIVIDSFNKSLFEFTVEGNSFLLTETFVASDLEINVNVYYLFLVIVILASLLLLTAIPDLSYLWFALGCMVFFLMLAFMAPENLGIFMTWGDKTLLVVMLASYLIPAFVFKQFFSSSAYALRFLIYLLTTGFWYYYISENATVSYPFLHLSAYGIVMPMVLTIVFIFVVAHENIRAFVVFTTHESVGVRGRSSYQRFMFLSVIYLLNLIVALLHLSKTLDLGLGYIHPFHIFIGSALFGMWGMKHRESQYNSIMSFAPTGAFLYIGGLLMSLATMGLVFAIANDPLYDVLEDAVLYSHIGFGLAFVLYVVFNFSDMMKVGEPIYRVLFRPMKLDLIYAMILGAAIVLGLLFNARFFPYHQTFAGYNNILGDLYRVTGEEYLSKQFYSLAIGYDRINHRSHYSLGNLAEASKDYGAAEYFYKQSTLKKPTAYAYARLANVFLRDKRYFESLFALKDGLEDFPENGELNNNLALLFGKTDMSDSVFIYLNLAKEFSGMPEVAESNIYAFQTKAGRENDLNSLINRENTIQDVGISSNKLVLFNKANKRFEEPLETSFVRDSVLSTPELCYLYNYALNAASTQADDLLPILDSLSLVDQNDQFSLFLNYARAIIHYKNGAFKDAFQLMEEVASIAGRTNPDYVYHLGLWMMEYDLNERAAKYFKQASYRGNAKALFDRAIALSELNDKSEALLVWEKILSGTDESQVEIARDMLRFISPDSLKDIELSSDLERFRYLHYNQNRVLQNEFDQLFEQVEADNFKVVVVAERVLYLLKQNLVDQAQTSLDKIAGLPIDGQTTAYFQEAFLALSYAQKKFGEEFGSLLSNKSFAQEKQYLLSFYQGVFRKYNRTNGAENYLKLSTEQNPFFHQSFLELSNLYAENENQDDSYNVLVSGLTYNPENVQLQKAYAFKCLELGYETFAETALSDLSDLLNPAQYQEFEVLYNNKKSEIEKTFEDWDL